LFTLWQFIWWMWHITPFMGRFRCYHPRLQPPRACCSLVEGWIVRQHLVRLMRYITENPLSVCRVCVCWLELDPIPGNNEIRAKYYWIENFVLSLFGLQIVEECDDDW
jgi:hypothetical protein